MDTLTRAVYKHMGYETLEPELIGMCYKVAGIGPCVFYGYFGYDEIANKFYDDNRKTINRVLKQDAEHFGVQMLKKVKDYYYLNNKYDETTIAEVMFDSSCNNEASVFIKNALAWYVIEKVATKVACEQVV